MTDRESERLRDSEPVEPGSVDDAVTILKRLWAAGIATAVVGAVPRAPGTQSRSVSVVSLARLDRIPRVDRESSALVAEAGAPIRAVRLAASAAGLWCPALRWIPGNTTIGGGVAGGHGRRSRRYGNLADYLLGSRIVSPAVGLVRHGGMAIKNATGYNLSASVAGSRGELAVILEVTLRLVPEPAHRRVRRFSFASSKSAWQAARSLADAGLGADAIEVASPLADGDARILLETEDAAASTAERNLAAMSSRAVSLGGREEPDTTWPPMLASGQRILRSGVDPARLGEFAATLSARAQTAGIRGHLLAEATGGSVEIALDPGSEAALGDILRDVNVPGSTPAAAHLQSLLKLAFDPKGLLTQL